MLDGDTEMDAPVPTKVPPQLPEYQFQAAPVPNEPPLTDNVVEPLHIGLELAVAPVGSVEGVFTVTVTGVQFVLLHVPSALT